MAAVRWLLTVPPEVAGGGAEACKRLLVVVWGLVRDCTDSTALQQRLGGRVWEHGIPRATLRSRTRPLRSICEGVSQAYEQRAD